MKPESYPGELFARAEALMKGTAADVFREKVTLLIYSLSSNASGVTSREQWEDIARVISNAGILNISANVDSFGCTTISAFFEKLLSEAVTWEAYGGESALQITK